MKLADAKLCPEEDCNEIYTEDFCPACTSTQCLVLASLIDPASRELRETIRQAEVTCENRRRKEV